MFRKLLGGHLDLTRADQMTFLVVAIVIVVVDALLYGLLF